MQIAALAVAEYPREFEDFLLPRGQQLLAGEFGEVRRYRLARVPSARTSSVRGACRWVSLPGETCKMPVSTSLNPCSSNHALSAREMAPLAARNGRMSAWRAADHQGEIGSFPAIRKPPRKRLKRWHPDAKSVCCSPKPLRWPRDTHVLIGPGPEHQEK